MSTSRGAVALCREVAPLRLRRLLPSAAWGTLTSVSNVALLATSAWLITRASLRPPVLLLAVAIASVQAFALLRGVARYGERLAVHDCSLGVLARLRLAVFDRLEPLVPGGLPGRRAGSLLGAFVTDADAVGDALARELTAAVEVGAGVVAGVAVAAVIDLLAGAVLAAGALAAVGIADGMRRASTSAARREAAARDELADAVVSAVRSSAELVAFGREDLVLGQVAAAEARAEGASRAWALAAGLGRAGIAAVSGATLLGVLAAGFTAHGDGHDRGTLSGVALAVLAFAVLAVLDVLGGLPDAAAAAAAGAASAERLAGLARLLPAAAEPEQPAIPPARPSGVALERATVVRGGCGDPRIGDGTRNGIALDGCSLELPPGRRVALVGRSGSGKSTAVLTLLHFLECAAGRASIGGRDVRSLARADLRDRIGWVPDVPHVFCGTVAANLRIANPGASDERCVDALRRVGLGPWLAALPDGLETPVGATGRPTSAGERQRLCLARALLAEPDVLLLDEPTAHLDPAGASAALGEVLDAAGGRSVLLVTHDEAALGCVDEVVRLE